MYRAKTIDEQEKALRRRQQEEREKFREEQQLLLKQKEEERRNQIQEKERARTTYKEKMKNATQLDVSVRRCFWGAVKYRAVCSDPCKFLRADCLGTVKYRAVFRIRTYKFLRANLDPAF